MKYNQHSEILYNRVQYKRYKAILKMKLRTGSFILVVFVKGL